MNEEFNNSFEQKEEETKRAIYTPIYEKEGIERPVYYAPKEILPYGFSQEKYDEKKGIKKVALTIGLSALLLLVISNLWAFPLFFVLELIGFSSGEIENFVSDPAMQQIFQIYVSIIMFSVPFIIVYKARKYKISELVPLGNTKKGNRFSLFLFGVAFCAFANIAVSQASAFFSSFGIEYNVDYGENPKGIFGFILSFTATAIVPALMEEFACRGLIMGSLRKFGEGFAILASALVFGLMHGNFQQIPFAFLVGLILGYIVVKSGSLWIAVLVHGFNNAISVIFDYCLSGLTDEAQNVVYLIFLALSLLAGLLAFLLTQNKKELFVLDNGGTQSSGKEKFRWFVFSPVIIIFAGLCFAESLQYFLPS